MTKGGLIVRKQEMTKIRHNDDFVAVTLLKIVPQNVVRYKTIEKDGYGAVVIGAEKSINEKKEKGIKERYKYLTEFKIDEQFQNSYKAGDILDLKVLEGVNSVKVRGISKGKGFQGVVRRYKFAGGPKTHGSKFHRLPGSIGNRKPRRVNKGHPLPGHMGLETVTLRSVPLIQTYEIDNEQIIALKGSVPGSYNSFLKIEIN